RQSRNGRPASPASHYMDVFLGAFGEHAGQVCPRCLDVRLILAHSKSRPGQRVDFGERVAQEKHTDLQEIVPVLFLDFVAQGAELSALDECMVVASEL